MLGLGLGLELGLGFAGPHDSRDREGNREQREHPARVGSCEDCHLDRQLWHVFQAHDQESYTQHETFVGQPVVHGVALAPWQQAHELHIGERDQQDERVKSRQLL